MPPPRARPRARQRDERRARLHLVRDRTSRAGLRHPPAGMAHQCRRPMGVRRTLLVANRGEIAVRIFSTCRRLGIAHRRGRRAGRRGRAPHPRRRHASSPVAVVPRRGRARRRRARERRASSSTPATASSPRARRSRRRSLAAGLTWVGPPPDALRRGGDKLEAKRIAARRGRADAPDRRARRSSASRCSSRRRRAAAGAGCAWSSGPSELEEAIEAAAREAEAAFGDGTVFCERYLPRPRHVEVQLIGDRHGNGRRARRARLLRAAPPPEGRRGVSPARPLRRPCARASRAHAVAFGDATRLRERGNGRVPRRRRRRRSSSSSTAGSRSSTRSPRR